MFRIRTGSGRSISCAHFFRNVTRALLVVFSGSLGMMKTLWNLFYNLIRTGFGCTIITFFAAQGIFIVCATKGWLSPILLKNGVEQALTAFLVMSVHLLVLSNTIILLLKLTPTIAPILYMRRNNESEVTLLKQTYDVFVISLVLASFISGCMSLLAFLAWSEVVRMPWTLVLEVNELSCLLLFALFLLADLCCLWVCRRATQTADASTNNLSVNLKAEIYELQLMILAVDIPGLLGVVSIVALSFMTFPEHVGVYYFQGFASGAISVHIVFSQTALALLGLVDNPFHGHSDH